MDATNSPELGSKTESFKFLGGPMFVVRSRGCVWDPPRLGTGELMGTESHSTLPCFVPRASLDLPGCGFSAGLRLVRTPRGRVMLKLSHFCSLGCSPVPLRSP